MALDPHNISSEASLLEYAPVGQLHQMPYLDRSWVPEVIAVEHDTLLDVELVWEPRGWTGVEYLVSWVEEGQMVSGQLVTKDNNAHLSLWPGQKYYIQVEVIDLQGNTVIKSHASPIVFQTESTGTTTTSDDGKVATTKYKSISTVTQITTPTTTSASDIYNNFSSDPLPIISELPPETTLSYLKSQQHISVSTSTDFVTTKYPTPLVSRSTPSVSNIQISIVDQSKKSNHNNTNTKHVRESIIIDYSPHDSEPESLDKYTVDDVTENVLEVVELKENENINSSSNISVIAVWGTGVVIGALLILCLCALVIWILKKSRKSKKSEYLPESSVNLNISQGAKEENQIKPIVNVEKLYEMSSVKHSVTPSLQKSSSLYGFHSGPQQEDYIVVSENPYQRRPLPPLPPMPPVIEMGI
ncbi:unnamed protein product [Meganyctiphanes norvegica]|uniref:Fibronectin type-III domain-containing protein n=1 Tax=Meganyctiphanes norvegica TaxID=48144 RepID=A0AAV2RLM4_MEGNR